MDAIEHIFFTITNHYFACYILSGIIFWYAFSYLTDSKHKIPSRHYQMVYGITTKMLLFSFEYGRLKLVLVLSTAIFIFFLGTTGLVVDIIKSL